METDGELAVAFRRSILLLVIGVIGLTTPSCRSFHGVTPAPGPRPAHIDLDTTAVVIHILNYNPQSILVALETGGDRLLLGRVAGLHEALFVLPGEKVADLRDFTVEITQNGHQLWRTALVKRTPGMMARVYLRVGTRPRGGISPAERFGRT